MRFPDFTIRSSTYRPGLRQERHDHPWTNVTAVLRGEIVEETDDGEHRARSCSVVIKPAGTMHSDRVLGSQAARTIAIELREGSELSRLAAARRWSWLEGADTVRATLALQQALISGLPHEIERAAHAILGTVLTQPPPAHAPPWLARLLRDIEKRMDDPMCFETMAVEIGLHPAYVSRAFRRFTGRTMTAHVRDLRLQRARHLLTTTGRSLAGVAADCGFADASHLCRAFAGSYAVTPGSFRRLVNA